MSCLPKYAFCSYKNGIKLGVYATMAKNKVFSTGVQFYNPWPIYTGLGAGYDNLMHYLQALVYLTSMVRNVLFQISIIIIAQYLKFADIARKWQDTGQFSAFLSLNCLKLCTMLSWKCVIVLKKWCFVYCM